MRFSTDCGDLAGRQIVIEAVIENEDEKTSVFGRLDKVVDDPHILPRLIEKDPDVFLLFVGPDGGELKKIQKLGESLGVTEYFKWLGPLRGKEKHEAFECCEFLALPSDEDPYPLALLEAMAHQKAVLTTSVVGPASVIGAYRPASSSPREIWTGSRTERPGC